MPRYIRTPDGLPQRLLKGRELYSHVVIAEPGEMIFISGQLSRNTEGGIVGRGDMAAQLKQVLSNLSAALAAAGSTMDELVQTTTYTTDLDLYFENIDARTAFFDENLPTSTAVQVSRLSHPDFLVEIEGIAVKAHAVLTANGPGEEQR